MKLSLGTKIVAGFIAISAITYGTSSFFIFVLKEWIAPGMADWLYVSIILLLGVLWTGILGWLTSKWLTRPIVHLAKAAEEATDGNWNVVIPERRSGDEIKVLYDAFRNMLTHIGGMLDEISYSTRTTSHNAETLSTAIAHATAQIEAMSNAVDDIVSGVEEQKKASELSLQTADQMLVDFRLMHSKSNQMMELSGKMEGSVHSTQSLFSSLMDGMDTLSESHQRSHEVIAKLEREADRIETITGTVKEIAEQTHLLALNASIEAARAGEEGNGFAVVAQHIRTLASQSSSSVEEINQMISHIQEQVTEAVSLMQQQNGLVREEANRTRSVETTLNDLHRIIDEFVDGVRMLENSVSEQTGRVEQTYDYMNRIQEMSVSFAEGAQQIYRAAHEETAIMQELSSASDDLRMLTGKLMLKTQAAQVRSEKSQ
ncbi:methyl-accepting chemotaxis protein [Paenibacillus sp. P96]|uniref:Methyl-accepting chemotaxis protein n=1 Tax=Paenibacillus zeirhizosphaerae TaxID=2987519 RepID=A0ABT9FWG8_9BACL|nr:methyl-accepting chemotaxis protein [Paenibacillus sp. P96]MDP4099055.1 methyl-accepting chemotaxis protein [Paenibacillus sp. P96]